MTSETKPRLVIFDTDMGADDAWALQMMLKAEKDLGNVKILAITTAVGNTSLENVIKNTYRILDGLNRTDIPIYKGASESIVPFVREEEPFWGSNGFGDIEVWKPHYPSDINSIVQAKGAVEAIRDLIMANPNEISLIAIGPLTNIGLAIKAFPEVKDNIKDVFIMGGNHKGRGNIALGAEFNFWADPIAAHIVLNSLECPMTVLTFECGLPGSISLSKEWRFNVLGSASNDANLQLLNEVERVAFTKRPLFTPFDALLTAVFLFPERCIRTKNQYNATVELHGSHTLGQMVINYRNPSGKHNVTVIETVNEEEIKKVLLWTASF